MDEFGLGPFLSIATNEGIGDSPLSVGLIASVVYRHRCMSFGLLYNNPIFYSGPCEYYKNNVYVTIGINFGNKAWNSIGKAALIASQVAGAVADNYSSNYSAYSGYDSYSGDYDSNNYSSSSSTGSNGNKYNMSEQRSYNSDKRTYENYDSQLSQYFAGNRKMSTSEVRNIQGKMRKLREKWENKGKSWTKVLNETRNP